MAFIIIETKRPIQSFKYIIVDILSKSYEITDIRESEHKLIIQHQPVKLSENDLFLNLAEELYADLKVYISADQPRFEEDTVLIWFDKLPFMQTTVYNDSLLLLKTTEFGLDEDFKKAILKRLYNDKEILHTVKTYLEHNQNMSKAAEKLFLHRNTLIQRLDKFHAKTGFDCRNFVDAYIIYSLIK